ncbi:MAG: hypothetical protein Q8858_07555 [Bacteroidota bacterium]|nr:hypothetical protein [Bacteroidota bacterium]
MSYFHIMKLPEFSEKTSAINIQLESLDPEGDALTFDTLIRVFNRFKASFRNFIEIEFLRTPYFLEIMKRTPRVLEDLKRDTELAIVQMNIDELFISFVPDLLEEETPLFPDEVLLWKRDRFEKFRQIVIFCNYHDTFAVNKILSEYSLSERIKIYKPIFDVISYDKNYKVNIIGSSKRIIGMFIPPHDVIKKQILSPAKPGIRI